DLEENAYIEPDTIVGMQGISGIPLGKALKELLDSVSGGGIRIAYVVDDGVITVATKESLPVKLVPRVYDITELIGTPATFSAEMDAGEDISGGGGGSGADIEVDSEGRLNNAAAIMQTIQDTVEPDSWFISGGEGMISSHGNKIIVSQTPPIHEQVQELLLSLGESLGQQVSIEARFLFVTENFLEDIGLDVKIMLGALGGGFGSMIIDQGSYEYARPSATLLPGSLPTAGTNMGLNTNIQYNGSILDDLSVGFFLRAAQVHRDAKMLTAPRITVLSSESAYIKVLKEIAYVSDYDFENVSTSGSGSTTANRTIADPETDTVTGGVVLNVTPTISADKKYVILEISTSYSKANLDSFDVFSETGKAYPIGLPTREIAEVRTRVSVPDGGTLLIGGQKLGAEINKEAGVPGMSKVPILGRLFTNRSKVKDQDILLILVKPTIILQDEAEREYFAPLE
ncbi:MAG: hypothetical protein U9Q07_08090, partial [Planctomycetota bacterium]|nr:hypothetical protein [Planctomycetota bacterium]